MKDFDNLHFSHNGSSPPCSFSSPHPSNYTLGLLQGIDMVDSETSHTKFS